MWNIYCWHILYVHEKKKIRNKRRVLQINFKNHSSEYVILRHVVIIKSIFMSCLLDFVQLHDNTYLNNCSEEDHHILLAEINKLQRSKFYRQ